MMDWTETHRFFTQLEEMHMNDRFCLYIFAHGNTKGLFLYTFIFTYHKRDEEGLL